MQHAPAVGIGDGVADVEEPAEQLAELQRPLGRVDVGAVGIVEAVDGVGQRVAADEPHGVERAAGGVVAQAVDGDDAGMLELAGDLGLEHELGASRAVVGMFVLDFLEGDLAVELVVEGDRDDAEPAAGMRPDDPEATVPGGRFAQRIPEDGSGTGRPTGESYLGMRRWAMLA